MARTAQAALKLRNNGVALGTSGFGTFDLTGSLSAVDAGGGVATVTGSGSAGSNIATEVLAGTQAGADVTLDLTGLAHTFVAVEVVFRNGQALKPTTDWSLSGSTITIVNADVTDTYMVQYTY